MNYWWAVTGNDNASVTVAPSTDPTTMSVASILAKVIGEGGGNKRPRATVSIVDDQGNPAGSATGTGAFIGSAADPSESEVTNSSARRCSTATTPRRAGSSSRSA